MAVLVTAAVTAELIQPIGLPCMTMVPNRRKNVSSTQDARPVLDSSPIRAPDLHAPQAKGL